MKTKLEQEYWRLLLETMLQCKTADRLDELLHLFLTMNERDYLVHRYRIVEALLTSGQTQREIAKDLGVSITKITDGSKAVQIISDKLRNFLVKEMNERKNRVKTNPGKAPRKKASGQRGD